MKIVLISPAYPLRGGIAASSERLALEFQAMGHEVVIYSFSVQYPSFLFPGKTQYTDDPPPPNLHIKTCLNSINPFNWLLVARAVASEKPDQIVVRFWLPFMGPCLGTVLRFARFFAAKRSKTTALVDNIIPHEKRFGDALFARWFVRSCDDFVVMSKSVGEEIKTFVSKNKETAIRFAPHPIYDIYGPLMDQSEARKALGIAAQAQVVLFFGFIRKYKGLDLLLEALHHAPNTIAVIAGECYEDWSFYEQIIDRHNLKNRIILHKDFVPSDQVKVFFSAANIVVQPYRTATQSGISQIAYHFEKPMIVTKVGGLPEIVTEGTSGYVVEPTPEAIAAAMRDFFEHKREDAYTEGVRIEKLRFSWRYLAEEVLGK
jgi:glycosyltransferase involved in cell wall biosynthesis